MARFADFELVPTVQSMRILLERCQRIRESFKLDKSLAATPLRIHLCRTHNFSDFQTVKKLPQNTLGTVFQRQTPDPDGSVKSFRVLKSDIHPFLKITFTGFKNIDVQGVFANMSQKWPKMT